MIQKVLGNIKGTAYSLIRRQRFMGQQDIINILKELYRATEYGYLFIRSQRPVVKFFGYGYQLSTSKIELDITYRCNLSCANCNRSVGVGQAKSNLDMSTEQIQKFVDQSRENNIRWEVIKLLGGEPTMHPQLDEIIGILKSYVDDYSPTTRLELWTNGDGKKVREVLGTLPDFIKVIDSSVTRGAEPLFNSFNLAPVDSRLYKYTDFSHGCSIIEKCGVGLTPYGYYPCAVAGGIDRVFGKNAGTHDLNEAYGKMRGQLDEFCRLCGHFRASKSSRNQNKSKTWTLAYHDYKKNKPTLDRF
ncbi:MAG: radical SAM protein [Gammaproteobacteria bacterium]|nr:radical SAM protein [Gammaproteobacteria bacterium]